MGPCEWNGLQQYIDCLKINTLGLVDVTLTFMPLIKKAQGMNDLDLGTTRSCDLYIFVRQDSKHIK